MRQSMRALLYAALVLAPQALLTADAQLAPAPATPVQDGSAPSNSQPLPVLPPSPPPANASQIQLLAPQGQPNPTPQPQALGTPAQGAVGAQQSGYAQGLTKPPFPFGGATAAYQVEGAAARDGRGPSIWDTYSHNSGKVKNGDTGDVAVDFYDRFRDDLATAQALGMKMFRFSISWSRVLPTGSGAVNQKGLDFYSTLIDTIIAAGLEPHATLYHWDLPQALQDNYGGWLSPVSITDFENYAAIVFRNFAGRVKHWTTFNEMQTFIQLGYNVGTFAPGRCSGSCPVGDSSTEPWTVLRNVLLAHGHAAAKLRNISSDALLSCNFNINWAIPLTDSADDKAAAQRYLDWHLGIYADPLFFGNFPASVLAAGLPNLYFTQDEQNLLKGSVNYFALNHYTSNYVTSYNGQVNGANQPQETNVNNDPRTGNTQAYAAKDGVPLGPVAESKWLIVYPQGLRDLLKYVDSYYKKPLIYITESGVSVPGESGMPLQQALNDTFRINYFQGYIQSAIDAVQQDGVNIQGYFAWSLLDNFEWLDGYSIRFGVVHIDYTNNLMRYVKESAKFLAAWFQGTSISSAGSVATASIG